MESVAHGALWRVRLRPRQVIFREVEYCTALEPASHNAGLQGETIGGVQWGSGNRSCKYLLDLGWSAFPAAKGEYGVPCSMWPCCCSRPHALLAMVQGPHAAPVQPISSLANDR